METFSMMSIAKQKIIFFEPLTKFVVENVNRRRGRKNTFIRNPRTQEFWKFYYRNQTDRSTDQSKPSWVPGFLINFLSSYPIFTTNFASTSFVLSILILISGCSHTKCATTSDCADGQICVTDLGLCKKVCQSAIDCSGSTVCTAIDANNRACLDASSTVTTPTTNQDDVTMGNQCISPNNDNVSQATPDLPACGSFFSSCSLVYGDDPQAPNIRTCTAACATGLDSECAAYKPKVCPPGATANDCTIAFDNSCCIGNVLPGSETATTAYYCRPRLFCYDEIKNCKSNADCPGGGNGRGPLCATVTGRTLGACVGGTRDLYECCERFGECKLDQDPNKSLFCTNSNDNLAGYCTKNCNTDSDCMTPQTPNGSCWDVAFGASGADAQNQCDVIPITTKMCRPIPKPSTPTTPKITCDFSDRDHILSLPDNHYDATLRRCVYQ